MNNEMVAVDFWERELVPTLQKEGYPILFCPLEGVTNLFKELEHSKEPVILVSAYSDYGLFYQKNFNPNKDYSKRIPYLYLYKEQVENFEGEYVIVPVLTHNKEKCNYFDKYSIKIDAWTDSTFTDIPDCIQNWYCCNLNVEHPKIKWIPFGINSEGHGKDVVKNYYNQNKKKLLYINFQDNTTQRMSIKHSYLKQAPQNEDWMTVLPQVGLPVEQFYKDLSEHAIVMCCAGNGFDSYRVYETYAVGSIPMLEDCIWSRNFWKMGLPALLVNHFHGITKEICLNSINSINKKSYNQEVLTKRFWIEKIRAEATKITK